MSEADALLADVRALRRKARADRHAYWLPLLFFGLAIVASAPLYVQRIVFSTDLNEANDLYEVAASSRLNEYWSVVLLTGALLTVWWYQRQGRRTGIEGRVGPPLVAGALFLVVYTVLSALPGAADYLWPLWLHHYTALLGVAVGLLALAWQERSRGLWVVAVAFLGALVLAVWPDVIGNLGLPTFGDPLRYEQLPALVLPALVLLTGGLVGALGSRRDR